MQRLANSFGLTRVSFAAGADYGTEADEETLAFAMIETAEGMTNLSSLAATLGFDGIHRARRSHPWARARPPRAPDFDREKPRNHFDAPRHMLRARQTAFSWRYAAAHRSTQLALSSGALT